MLEVCLDNPQVKCHHEVQQSISDILSCQGNLSIKKINNRFLLSDYPFHLLLFTGVYDDYLLISLGKQLAFTVHTMPL